jgi:hypothetical protein
MMETLVVLSEECVEDFIESLSKGKEPENPPLKSLSIEEQYIYDVDMSFKDVFDNYDVIMPHDITEYIPSLGNAKEIKNFKPNPNFYDCPAKTN